MRRDNTRNCFDEMGAYFIEHPKVYIYGTGAVALDLNRILEPLNCIEAFIDSHPSKAGKQFCGRDVILPGQLPMEQDYIIIIANYNIESDSEMRKLLSYYGAVLNVFSAYAFKANLLAIYALFVHKKVWIGHLPYSITEKCTLNCEKCNHFTAFNHNPVNFTFESVCQDFDTFFGVVDYVYNDVILVGGEPFLHPDLYEIVAYVSSKYKEQYRDLIIISNGTVIPSDNLLSLFAERNVKITISDYREAVPEVRDKVNKVLDIFNKNEIVPAISSNLVWTAYDIGSAETGFCSPSEVEYHFNRCNYPCRYLRDGKLYFCTSDHMAQKLNLIKTDAESYIDLSVMNKQDGDFSAKRRVVEYDFGYVNERGYLNSCASCYGGWKISEKVVPVAEQHTRAKGD